MSGAELGSLAGVAAAAYYTSACAIWPYRRCLVCKGRPQRQAWWGGETFRLCGWCKGTGRRLRFGRWIFNRLFKRTAK